MMPSAKRLEEGLGHNPVSEVYEEGEHKKEVVTSSSSGDAIDRVDEKRAVTSTELPEVAEEEQPVQVKKKSKRVATLDAFRGLTVVVMILMDDAGWAYARIDHSPWNECTVADFVMHFFLFIVGVAIGLALKIIIEKV